MESQLGFWRYPYCLWTIHLLPLQMNLVNGRFNLALHSMPLNRCSEGWSFSQIWRRFNHITPTPPIHTRWASTNSPFTQTCNSNSDSSQTFCLIQTHLSFLLLNPPSKDPTSKLTGQPKAPCLQSRTKGNAGPVGHSAQSRPLNHGPWSITSLCHSRNSSLLIAPISMEMQAVMVGGHKGPSSTSRTTESQPKPNTHTRHRPKSVIRKAATSKSPRLPQFLNAKACKPPSLNDQSQCPLTQWTGVTTLLEFSTTVVTRPTMQFCWWESLEEPGRSRTPGGRHGARMGSSDWHQETPVASVSGVVVIRIDCGVGWLALWQIILGNLSFNWSQISLIQVYKL